MEIPKFGQPQNADPYAIPQPGPSKKVIWFMFGGVALLLLILGFIFFGGGSSKKGQPELKSATESITQSVAILDSYIDSIASSGLKNDLALSQIILRGNQQNLTKLYNETYSGKKLSATQKPNEKTIEALDRAKRDNVLDSAIVVKLKEELSGSQKNLTIAKPSFTKPSSKETVTKAQVDVTEILKILNKPR